MTIIEKQQCILEFIGFLSSIVEPSMTAKNHIGYVINATKKKTTESYGIQQLQENPRYLQIRIVGRCPDY